MNLKINKNPIAPKAPILTGAPNVNLTNNTKNDNRQPIFGGMPPSTKNDNGQPIFGGMPQLTQKQKRKPLFGGTLQKHN